MRNILGITVGVFLAASTGFSKTASKPKWAVEGLYVEACQCSIPCPCNFGQKPTHGSCDNTSVYQIQKGNYEAVQLGGLYVVVVGSSPAGERYVDAVGNLTFARYYVDERANPRQRQALEEIARALNASYLRLPTRTLSADEEVKIVPIRADVSADRAEVAIPSVLEFSTSGYTAPRTRNLSKSSTGLYSLNGCRRSGQASQKPTSTMESGSGTTAAAAPTSLASWPTAICRAYSQASELHIIELRNPS